MTDPYGAEAGSSATGKVPRSGAMQRARWAAARLAFAVAFASAPAIAQGQSTVAEGLFNEGRALFDQGNYEAACPKFRESDRLEPAVGTKLNLAMCEESRGRIATAWALFRVVVETVPPNDPRHALAEEHRQALGPRVPYMVVQLRPGAPADTTARLGELELKAASFGAKLPVDPGEHTLVVSAQGHADASFELTAVEGQTTPVEVEPGAQDTAPAAQSAPVESAEPAPERPLFTPLRIGGVVAGGLGVVSLALGGIFTAQAVSKNDDSMADCDGNVCGPEGKESRLDAQSAGNAATATVILGVVLVGAGAALWFIGAPDETAVQAGAVLTPGGASVALRGTLP